MEKTATQTDARGRRRRKLIAWFAGSLVVLLGGLFATAVYAVGPPEGTLRYQWSIGERYGLDADADGIIDNPDGLKDLAKDQAWIQSPTYALTFDVCSSPAVTERASLNPTFTLTLSGPEAKTVSGSACKMVAQVTKLGTFTAKVDVKVAGVSVDSRTETITPKDQLVVSIGDSVASGEGNPDTLQGGTYWAPKWQNEQCHRTSLAGPAQAALRLERRDPHSAITFVHVACSGASITKGLVGDYEGQAPAAGKMLKPQLDQVRDLVGNRPIDALTVSIGANDAEFANVVKACLMQANCHQDVPGVTNGKTLYDQKAPMIDANYPLLDARLDKMAKQLAGDARLRGKVYVTQYMDVTKDDRGQYCTGLTQKEIEAGKVPGDTSSTDGINQAEMTWADTYVQDGLNAKVKANVDKANANGGAQLVWVDGIKEEFKNNGYCAQDRYIRTLFESGLYQRGIDGAFHPNAEGHLFGYAKHIEPKLATDLGIGGTALPLQLDDAGQLADGLHSWIANLDKTGGLDALTNALPLGARDQVQTFLRDKFFGKFLPFLETNFSKGYTSVTELSEKLDDLDGDGVPGVDAFGVANLDLDISGDIQPKLPSKQYDVTLTIKGSVAMDPDLALKAGEIGLTNGKTDGKAEFSQTVKLHFDFTKPISDNLRLTIDKEGLSGQIKVNLGADFGGTDGPANGTDRPPLAFNAGGLGLKAVGPANANVVLGYSIKDPNGDGRIDATEMGRPLDWVSAKCISGAVNVNLNASASLVGFSSKLGSVKMVDANLCDGFDPP
ncbi:MAG TPA: SGNH/GDSL hydrolase family protein, partial [Aquihabitans sp.]|nr:SGNH/GDSL hydrolase family protein [Aquihabitans sp.]